MNRWRANAPLLSSSLYLALAIAVLPGFAIEPPITCVAFSPDGKSVVTCSQAGLKIYSWPDLDLTNEFKLDAPNLHDVAFSPKGSRLAVAGGAPSESGSVQIFSWPNVKSLGKLEESSDSFMTVTWLDASLIGAGSLDHNITVWDTNSKKTLKTLSGHSRGVAAVCFLPDRNTLASGGIDQSLRVWDLSTETLIHSLNIHTLPIHDLAHRPSKDGLPMIASASQDRTVRFWQPTIGRLVRFVRLKAIPLVIRWLPDGSQIVAGCTDGHVRLIDPVEVNVTIDVPSTAGWCYSLAVHPTDGTIVVGGQNGGLKRIRLLAASR